MHVDINSSGMAIKIVRQRHIASIMKKKEEKGRKIYTCDGIERGCELTSKSFAEIPSLIVNSRFQDL